jgi:protein SCO1/2
MWRCASLALAFVSLAAQAALDEKLALRESQAAIGRSIGEYALRDTEGRTVRFADLRGKPLVVQFIYTGCIQVCPASTAFLAKAVREAERTLGPGTFRVATIGFNLPFDSPESMAEFRRKHGRDSPNWLFLTPEANVDADGRIYRQVYGDQFDVPLFVGPLLELAQNRPVPAGGVQGLWEQVKLLCTVYDPAAGRYRVNYAVLIEILVGASVLLFGITSVAVEWRRRKLTHIKDDGARTS